MSSRTKLEFTIYTKDGQIKMVNKKGFTESILSVWPSSRLKMNVQLMRKTRSNEQNAYLWGVVYPLMLAGFERAGNVGFDVAMIHNFMKEKFLPGITVMLADGTQDVQKAKPTTTTLTTTEMAEYITFLQAWASDHLGVYIPDPNEQTSLLFNQ